MAYGSPPEILVYRVLVQGVHERTVLIIVGGRHLPEVRVEKNYEEIVSFCRFFSIDLPPSVPPISRDRFFAELTNLKNRHPDLLNIVLPKLVEPFWEVDRHFKIQKKKSR